MTVEFQLAGLPFVGEKWCYPRVQVVAGSPQLPGSQAERGTGRGGVPPCQATGLHLQLWAPIKRFLLDNPSTRSCFPISLFFFVPGF